MSKSNWTKRHSGHAARRWTCVIVVSIVVIEALLRVYQVEDVHVWNLPTKAKGYLHVGEPCYSPGQEEKARQMEKALFLFTDWAESVGLRYWIDFGTLLGAVRDGKMIPWDWDVDVGVMKEEIESIPQLNPLLKSKGLSRTRSTTCRLAICLESDSSNRSCVDVFMHIIRESDNFVIRCELDDVFRYQFPASFINPTKPIMFEGHMVQGPNHPGQMLKQYRYPYSYGWTVPRNFSCYFTEWKYFWLLATFIILPGLLVIVAIGFCCYKCGCYCSLQ